MYSPLVVVDAKNSIETAVGVAAALSTVVMATHRVYAYSCTTNSWIKQDASGNSPVASAASGSMFVPAGFVVYLDGSYGDTLSVIRDTADGKCTVTPVAQTH
jgi:hypothetical protein